MVGPHRKPQADVYTVFLAIALFAVLVAMVFLYLETKDYPNKTTGAPSVVAWRDVPPGGLPPVDFALAARPTDGGRAACDGFS
ncbi:MAG: hypothetical protein JW809_11705 [Pirellulales bacterium]|nr:hypothetical protein [Pirellulales bacterium]